MLKRNCKFSIALFSGVLTELCDPNDACNLDEKAFKGIFVRNLRYLLDASQHMHQFHTETRKYTEFLERNVKAMVVNASCMPENGNDRLRYVIIIYLFCCSAFYVIIYCFTGGSSKTFGIFQKSQP